MHVTVTVHVIQRYSSRPERLELSAHFGKQLPASVGNTEETHSSSKEVRAQSATAIKERWNAGRRKRRGTVHYHQM
jgi:hypothetical protein